MTTELKYLAFVTTLTALIWIPYILNMIMVRGLIDAVGYPENPKPMAPWATRMRAAHYNAVENLVVFAALVLVAHAAGVKGEATATACIIYFWARVVHLGAHTFAIPWVRTLAFVVGWVCQLTLAYKILVP
ncbi:MAG TPA: MAPEG family protein [Burkholderiales bacterium]